MSFFERYAQALAARDVDAVTALHHAPCLKIHGDGSIECLATNQELRAFFQRLMVNYQARDGSDSGGHFDAFDVLPIGHQAALASLTWELRQKDGIVYRRFRRSYNLVRSGTEWKIVAATAHREQHEHLSSVAALCLGPVLAQAQPNLQPQ